MKTFSDIGWFRPVAAILAAAVIGGAAAVSGGDEPKPPAITPEALKKAEANYRDIYGSDHEKAAASKKPADRTAFARLLLADSKKPAVQASPALVRVLWERALEFAGADKDGTAVAVEIRKLQLAAADDRLPLLPELAAALEKAAKAERPGTKARLEYAGEMVEALREAARLQAAADDVDAALATLAKAKSAARAYRPGDVKEIEGDEKELLARKEHEKKIAGLRDILRKVPQDPKANQELGLILLADGDSAGAASHLALAKAEPLAELGKLLSDTAADDSVVGDAARDASAVKGLAAGDKELLTELARSRYQTFLEKNAGSPKAAAVSLKLEKLPKPSETGPKATPGKLPPGVVCLFDEEAKWVEAFRKSGTAIADGSVSAETARPFQGRIAIRMTGFQQHLQSVEGWNFVIAEKPKPGEFRFAAFAWRASGKRGLMVQFNSGNDPVKWMRIGAGEDCHPGHPSHFVSRKAPADWETVVVDLYRLFGPMRITGIAFTALGDGEACFDSLYLGRNEPELRSVLKSR